MSSLRELEACQIGEVLAVGAEKQVPIVVTVHCGDHWINLPSRLIGLGAGYCWLEMPGPDRSGNPYEFEVTDKIAVSFKLKHYKYLFTAGVSEIRLISHDDIDATEAMCIYIPEKMQRISRRAFERVDVPGNRIVRVSLWQGGRDVEPTSTDTDRPVFLGAVTNISAGGFRIRTDPNAADLFEVGDVAGIRMVFGPGDLSLYADAQFRHAAMEEECVQLGFQFVGLGRTEEDLKALQMLSQKVTEFQSQAKAAVSTSTR